MHKFDPDKIELLVSKERFEEVRPLELLRRYGLKEGRTFVDVGCGPGFFSVPASEVVGPKGRVYAVDTEERMLEELKKRGLPENVIPLRSEENSIPLEDETADFVLLAYVLHEAVNKERFLKEVLRILREGGTALIIDWEKKDEDRGPPFDERLDRKDAQKLLKEAGFTVKKTGNLNPSHYMIEAVKGRPACKGP